MEEIFNAEEMRKIVRAKIEKEADSIATSIITKLKELILYQANKGNCSLVQTFSCKEIVMYEKAMEIANAYFKNRQFDFKILKEGYAEDEFYEFEVKVSWEEKIVS